MSGRTVARWQVACSMNCLDASCLTRGEQANTEHEEGRQPWNATITGWTGLVVDMWVNLWGRWEGQTFAKVWGNSLIR